MSGAIPEVCGDLPVEKGSWLSSGQALVDISGKKMMYMKYRVNVRDVESPFRRGGLGGVWVMP